MRITRLAPLVLAMVLAGCATGPKTDWAPRVGNYTYDQAVQELGVPDKTVPLTDSSRVAEWLTRSDGPAVIESGPGFYGSPFWGGPEIVTVYPSSPYAGKWLRLIFGPDGKLRSWKYFHR